MKRIEALVIETPGQIMDQRVADAAPLILTASGIVIKNVFGPTGSIQPTEKGEAVQGDARQDDEQQLGRQFHPFCNADGERSAKAAAAHVYGHFIGLGLSAKAAAQCAYIVAAEMEDKAEY